MPISNRVRRQYRTQVLEVFSPSGPIRHLIIERVDGKPIVCGWDVLQALKDEALGEDTAAIEIFPAAKDVVDEIPRRHLWEVPDASRLPTLRRQ